MSIFGSIMSTIFGKSAHASTLPAGATPSSPTGAAAGGAPLPPGATPLAAVDVTEIMDSLAEESDEELDWQKSIVDLMKLLKLDSSLKARKELASELKFPGDMSDSASMNVWLHKQVMTKLAENGGKVPPGLGHA